MFFQRDRNTENQPLQKSLSNKVSTPKDSKKEFKLVPMGKSAPMDKNKAISWSKILKKTAEDEIRLEKIKKLFAYNPEGLKLIRQIIVGEIRYSYIVKEIDSISKGENAGKSLSGPATAGPTNNL